MDPILKSCISIPGISDHCIVLADCKLKTPITNKPQRRVYRWSKADWHKIKGLTTTFAESFLALANSRSVNDNYLVFKKIMEGLLKTDIPSKLDNRGYRPFTTYNGSDSGKTVFILVKYGF